MFEIGHPVNIKDLKFKGAHNGATLKFRRYPDDPSNGGDPLEDDMDSTITNCDFANGGSEGFTDAVDIDYRGRNLIVSGCKFVTGGATGKAIVLTYRCNNNESAIVADREGWKRIMITNNNFHNFEGGCIHVKQPEQLSTQGTWPKLRGLVVSHNTMETDGVFFTTENDNVRLEGASFTGNTLLSFTVNNSVIDIHQSHACVFTGNVFAGTMNKDLSASRRTNVNIKVAYATAFVGNTFILAQGAQGDPGGALTGETWDNCSIIGNTWFGAATNKVDITTLIDCEIPTNYPRTDYRN
jgi:hypothetical protein